MLGHPILDSILTDMSDATRFSYIKKFIREKFSEIDMTKLKFEHIDKTHFRIHVKTWSGRVTYSSAFSKPENLAKYINRKYTSLEAEAKEKSDKEAWQSKNTSMDISAEDVEKAPSEIELSKLFSKDMKRLTSFINSNKMRHALTTETNLFLERVSKSPTQNLWEQ